MAKYYFEDFAAGWRCECPPRLMTREEIVAFASEYDPQPFHLDEEAAKDSFFGQLVASGWHTASLCMRAMTDGFLGETAGLGSPGIEELKWMRPVAVGDTIHVKTQVIDRKESRSRVGVGLVRFRTDTFNQRGEQVMMWDNWIMIARREAGAP